MAIETIILGIFLATIYTLLIFVAGYVLGKLNLLSKTLANSPESANTKGWFEKMKTKKPKKIDIDETKFVTDVRTDSFEKDFESLGEKTVSNDGIGASVSKLKQLKKVRE